MNDYQSLLVLYEKLEQFIIEFDKVKCQLTESSFEVRECLEKTEKYKSYDPKKSFNLLKFTLAFIGWFIVFFVYSTYFVDALSSFIDALISVFPSFVSLGDQGLQIFLMIPLSFGISYCILELFILIFPGVYKKWIAFERDNYAGIVKDLIYKYENYNKVKEKYDDLCNSMGFELLEDHVPVKYQTKEALSFFVVCLKNKMADTEKELFKSYENYLVQKEMLETQRELERIQSMQLDSIRRQEDLNSLLQSQRELEAQVKLFTRLNILNLIHMNSEKKREGKNSRY